MANTAIKETNITLQHETTSSLLQCLLCLVAKSPIENYPEIPEHHC